MGRVTACDFMILCPRLHHVKTNSRGEVACSGRRREKKPSLAKRKTGAEQCSCFLRQSSQCYIGREDVDFLCAPRICVKQGKSYKQSSCSRLRHFEFSAVQCEFFSESERGVNQGRLAGCFCDATPSGVASHSHPRAGNRGLQQDARHHSKHTFISHL